MKRVDAKVIGPQEIKLTHKYTKQQGANGKISPTKVLQYSWGFTSVLYFHLLHSLFTYTFYLITVLCKILQSYCDSLSLLLQLVVLENWLITKSCRSCEKHLTNNIWQYAVKKIKVNIQLSTLRLSLSLESSVFLIIYSYWKLSSVTLKKIGLLEFLDRPVSEATEQV